VIAVIQAQCHNGTEKRMDSSFSLAHWVIVLGLLGVVAFVVWLFVRRRGERNAKARSAFLKGFAVGFGIAILTGGLQLSSAQLFPAPGSINIGALLDLLVQGMMLGVLIGGASAGVSLRRSRPQQQ
jgi:predicted cation transporter